MKDDNSNLNVKRHLNSASWCMNAGKANIHHLSRKDDCSKFECS